MAAMGTLCESFHEYVSFHDRKLAQRQLMSFLFFSFIITDGKRLNYIRANKFYSIHLTLTILFSQNVFFLSFVLLLLVGRPSNSFDRARIETEKEL